MKKVASKSKGAGGITQAVTRQRNKVKVLEKQLKEEKKKLEAIDPVLIAAKEYAADAKKMGVGTCIDGLDSIKSYVVAACMKADPSIRLGVRLVNDTYRMHFYPSIEAFEVEAPGDTEVTTREDHGYQTIWVTKDVCGAILSALAKRRAVFSFPKKEVLAGHCCD